jgi:hypothetical protein
MAESTFKDVPHFYDLCVTIALLTVNCTPSSETIAKPFPLNAKLPRHNNNLHSGQAAVVRPFEYIICRLNGNFLTPKDPLTYRRRKDNHLTSRVLADSAPQPQKINNSFNAFPNLSTQPTPKIGGNTVDFTEKMLEQRLKLEELKMLFNKYYRPEDAAQMFLLAVNLGDENFLDKKLDWLRRFDSMKSGSQSPFANSLESIERIACPLPSLFLAPGLYGASTVGFSDGRNILGYKGHVCKECLSWRIEVIPDDEKRLLKSDHTCDPQTLQKAQSVTDIPGTIRKRRQELIFYLTLACANNIYNQQELVGLAVEVSASVFDIRLNNYEECIDLDSLESVTPDWVYRAVKEGKTMINRIDLQEFLVIFEATLGFFRLTIDGVKRYFFVYIAKGLEPWDIKYLKKFFNTDSPITMNPTQSTVSELPASLPELLKGVNPGRPVNLTGANPGVVPNIAGPIPAGPTNKTIPTPTQRNKILPNPSTSTTTTTQQTNTLPFNNSNPNPPPTQHNTITAIIPPPPPSGSNPTPNKITSIGSTTPESQARLQTKKQ